jgi:hypothetical protein
MRHEDLRCVSRSFGRINPQLWTDEGAFGSDLAVPFSGQIPRSFRVAVSIIQPVIVRESGK